MPARRGGKPRSTRSANQPLVAPFTPQRKSGRPTRPSRRTQEDIPSSPPPLPDPQTPAREPSPPSLPPPLPLPPKRTDKSGALARQRLSATQLLEIRRKDKTRDEGSTRGIVADVGVQPRTELAKKVRESYQEAQDRDREVSARVRARLAKEQEEWQAEIAQFGEPEARRRRREEREAMADRDILPTSDLEHMEMEEERANPTIRIHSTLRVNKKFEWQGSLKERTLQEFNLADYEETLIKEIEKRDGWTKGWVLTHRTVIIKALHPKAKRIPQSIDDFIESEWEKVLDVIHRESIRFGEIIELTIEILAETKQLPFPPKPPAKRQHVELSSDPADPPQERKRVTRTDKLLDSARERAEALEAAGNYDKKLLDRWQCRNQECRNMNGFCFIDFEGKHFDIDSIQQMRWSKAIQKGDLGVSIERPPTEIYKSWQKQAECPR